MPSGIIKRHITDEANARLAFYLHLQPEQTPLSEIPPRPQLPQGVVDAPLIRVFNFLRGSYFDFPYCLLNYQTQK
jgi:mediator of RNA polymerase II transcription subunit 14